MLLVAACADDSESGADCPPIEPSDRREEGVQVLLDLFDDQSGYVRTELPGWRLRLVFIPRTEGREDSQAGFYYAPEPMDGAPTTIVHRDEQGQWQISQDERASMPDDARVLELTDLRMAPESVARTFEQGVPGVAVQGIGLTRQDCELVWHAGGFIMDGDGRPREVVQGDVNDASGDFELTDRYEVPKGGR